MTAKEETTTLEVSRDVLRDAMMRATYYIAQLERGHLATGARRECVYIRGLFDELVDELNEQEAKDNERS